MLGRLLKKFFFVWTGNNRPSVDHPAYQARYSYTNDMIRFGLKNRLYQCTEILRAYDGLVVGSLRNTKLES